MGLLLLFMVVFTVCILVMWHIVHNTVAFLSVAIITSIGYVIVCIIILLYLTGRIGVVVETPEVQNPQARSKIEVSISGGCVDRRPYSII